MPCFCESRTGTWKGSGRCRRGADGPGGRGGMFEGSEAPESAVAGRYQRRQTRQAASALFWPLFTLAEFCTAAPRLITGHLVQLPLELPVRASPLGDSNDESTHLECGDLAGCQAITAALGRYLAEYPCPRGIQTSFQHGMALLPRGWSRGESRPPAQLHRHRLRVSVAAAGPVSERETRSRRSGATRNGAALARSFRAPG